MFEFDGLVRKEQYKDLMREAAKEELVREALASRARTVPFYMRVLVWLVERLVVWCFYSPMLSPRARTKISQHPNQANCASCE